MNIEPTRQVHLDFHTSELIPDVGARFDKRQFQEALKLGRVNLINVFAKCHHGWSYYPTKIGKAHPTLRGDLLGSQIEACHEIGVRAPVYYTGGWSAHDAETHPEWCMRDAAGSFVAREWKADALPTDPKPFTQWKMLCVSGAYHELMKKQTEEICRLYPVDGMFYDIYQAQHTCYCAGCRAAMEAGGLDAADPRQAEAHRARTIRAHIDELSAVIRARHPTASIYFNGVTSLDRPQNFRYRLYQGNTKNDLEDLPTTWGGYDKLPLRAKVFHRERKPIVAMTGKFHTTWGEFGGFKHPDAIRFEAASMIAYGASCNVGDHLHPGGLMDMSTYRNIGEAYAYVERIEAYGPGGLPAASLGLWVSHEPEADQGVVRMLLDGGLDFDVVGGPDDLGRFQTVLIPSASGVLGSGAGALEAYLKGGGTVFALGDGILGSAGPAIACGADYRGPGTYDVDYTVVDESLRGDPRHFLPSSPFLNYRAAGRFAPHPGSVVLAGVQEPYFSRTYDAYSGHLNTPNHPVPSRGAAAWRRGGLVVAAHALDRMYYTDGARVHRDFYLRLLRLLHTRPMVETSLPSAGRVSLLHQTRARRYVAHLLYGPPIQRGRCLVIEDLPTLRDTMVRLRLPVEVNRLRLVPDGGELPLRRTTGDDVMVETTVPAMQAHCAVVAEY